MRLRGVILGALAAGLAMAQAAAPARIIFDTDLGNDVDDALALAMLHAFQSRHEAQLLAVTTTKDHPLVGPAIDAIDTFYGRPEIPIGVVKQGKTAQDSAMLTALADARRHPHRLTDGRQAPDAVEVIRRTLEAQPDASVTIVQVGFSTNLARLLEKHTALAARKVRLLVMMAGNFADGQPEFNVKIDVPSAQRVFREWPTPIVVSGFEVGRGILFRASTVERAFAYAERHPIADAYRAYMKMPYDRPTWDLTAVLYGVRPEGGYFTVSEAGTVDVDERGGTRFTASAGGRHRILSANAEQRVRTLEACEELASEPPCLACK